MNCLKAIKRVYINLRFVQGQWIYVDSSPFRRVKAFLYSIFPMAQEGWNWLCPWMWPPHSSRVEHQGLHLQPPLPYSAVKSVWRNPFLMTWLLQGSPSDDEGLGQRKQSFYSCSFLVSGSKANKSRNTWLQGSDDNKKFGQKRKREQQKKK